MSIADAILNATEILRKAGVPEARREAGALLAHVLGRDRTFLISHAEDEIDDSTNFRFLELVNRRASGEPQQYITGTQNFFGREFKVNSSVLIPRPETELLVEAALKIMGEGNAFVCDVGTGSGCIAITILCERLNCRAVALDISAAALLVANENAVEHKVEDRVSFFESDCYASLPPDLPKFDLIVSNPPYVSAEAVTGLQREVRDHEPQVALTPGADSLSVIRKLLTQSPELLKQQGHLILEIGFDQAEKVTALIDKVVWSLIEILPDLQGIPRIVVLRKRAENPVTSQ